MNTSTGEIMAGGEADDDNDDDDDEHHPSAALTVETDSADVGQQLLSVYIGHL